MGKPAGGVLAMPQDILNQNSRLRIMKKYQILYFNHCWALFAGISAQNSNPALRGNADE
jgi:hypothetical protein